MNGPEWPPGWRTGWVSFHYSDIEGNSPVGTVILSNLVERAAVKSSHTHVIGGSITVPIEGGAPGGPKAQQNAAGVMCYEFPIGNDPDVVPASIRLAAKETFPNGKTIYADLTEEHTLDNPLWLTDDLDTVKGQAGVTQIPLWKVATHSMGIPERAAVGDLIWYLDINRITEKTGA
jgi:hypothetical protein